MTTTNMKQPVKKTLGFTLIELMVSMAVGIVVIGAAAELFKSGMDATALVTQQADMQQNVRSALNMVARDVSMAGSGLPPGGLALPYGVGSSLSGYGCDQTSTCYVTANTYPSGTVAGSTVSNYMYGLIPGFATGMKAGSWTATVPATGATPDRVTSVYVDYSFPLNQYIVDFNNAGGTSINVTPPATPPAGFPGIISPTGINVGDLILLQNTRGAAVGESDRYLCHWRRHRQNHFRRWRSPKYQSVGGGQWKYRISSRRLRDPDGACDYERHTFVGNLLLSRSPRHREPADAASDASG